MKRRSPREQIAQLSAHRGGAERYPAATYEAYRDAVTSGAEYAELDIRRLADGTLVVYHDEHAGPARWRGGTGSSGRSGSVEGPALAGLGYRELCAATGYEVPRVADVLAILGGRLGAHLDLKEVGYEAEVIDLTLRLVGEDFVATSLEDASIAAITAGYPHVRAALSLGRDLTGLSGAAALAVRRAELFPDRCLRACGATGIAVHHRLARLRLLDLARARGLEAWVWTVDDDDLIRRLLLDARVTTLVTNRPHRAAELRAGTGAGTGQVR